MHRTLSKLYFALSAETQLLQCLLAVQYCYYSTVHVLVLRYSSILSVLSSTIATRASTRFATAIVRCLVMYFLRPIVMIREQFAAYFVRTMELIHRAISLF